MVFHCSTFPPNGRHRCNQKTFSKPASLCVYWQHWRQPSRLLIIKYLSHHSYWSLIVSLSYHSPELITYCTLFWIGGYSVHHPLPYSAYCPWTSILHWHLPFRGLFQKCMWRHLFWTFRTNHRYGINISTYAQFSWRIYCRTWYKSFENFEICSQSLERENKLISRLIRMIHDRIHHNTNLISNFLANVSSSSWWCRWWTTQRLFLFLWRTAVFPFQRWWSTTSSNQPKSAYCHRWDHW